MLRKLFLVTGLCLMLAACGTQAEPVYNVDTTEADAIIAQANETATAIVGNALDRVEDSGEEADFGPVITGEETPDIVDEVIVLVPTQAAMATEEADFGSVIIGEETPEVSDDDDMPVATEEVVEATQAVEILVTDEAVATEDIVVEEPVEVTEEVIATEEMIATEEAIATEEMVATEEAVAEVTAEVTEEAIAEATEEMVATAEMDTATTEEIEVDFDPIAAEDDPLAIFVSLANAGNGEALFNENFETAAGIWMCSSCHNIDNDEVKIGPSQWGIPARANLRLEGQGPYTYLFNSIKNSQEYVVPAFEGLTMMPEYGDVLSDAQIYDLVAYLMTLEKPE